MSPRTVPPCPLCGKPLVILANLFFFPLDWHPPRQVDGFCMLGSYVKPHLSDATKMVLYADIRSSRRNAGRRIERRFGTRFKRCSNPISFERMWLPKKREFPEDLRALVQQKKPR
ncbi:MAG: hypothetical protein Q8Q36_03145 [bacterium]|nr:hypothetical protein [bacterium]